MHIYFSGIGGTGIGPLALIAKQAGYEVSGSDKQHSQYIEYLKKQGVTNIHIGQEAEGIAAVQAERPIDWFVYSSALVKENPDHPELKFCEQQGIKTSKRDEFTNKFIKDNRLKLVAVAGTHGKTTTTAMLIWLFKQLKIPLSYSVGAKIAFGDMGHFEPGSKYFVYECDEFDRNFLAFKPYLSLITGIAWDHHEIYDSAQEYHDAFKDFVKQSQSCVIWNADAELLNMLSNSKTERAVIENTSHPGISQIGLAGLYNRRDAWLAITALHRITDEPMDKLIKIISKFPGVSRRFEKLRENLYTDYAHTPEKIIGALSVARETARPNQKLVVIYEPLTNRRMHYTASQHKNVFEGAAAIYWVPSYLAREDPRMDVLTPGQLIKNLNPGLQSLAKPAVLDDKLAQIIKNHLKNGDLVLALSGGGGKSLDEWLRKEF